jgi:hypothetical protein
MTSGAWRRQVSSTVAGQLDSEWRAPGAQYEYRVLAFPQSISRGDACRMLTEEADYGRWELARTLVYTGGRRKVWLRRRIIRVRSTLDSIAH